MPSRTWITFPFHSPNHLLQTLRIKPSRPIQFPLSHLKMQFAQILFEIVGAAGVASAVSPRPYRRVRIIPKKKVT